MSGGYNALAAYHKQTKPKWECLKVKKSKPKDTNHKQPAKAFPNKSTTMGQAIK